ncbi:MAG: hypothetical protein ACI9XO_004727 [Paraglaciecola sp.]
MSKSNNNTAILVFIRSEKEEAQIKKFGSCLSFKGNCQVASLLNKRVKSIARKSGLPIIVVSGNQQNGDNFGQRFTDAVTQVFEKGYDNVLAIGNDCLSISSNLLREAASVVKEEKVVIGSTQNGGVYLLGFQKTAFHQTEFASLPWQTNQLFFTLKKYFQNKISANFYFLKIARDANDADSFQTILNQLSDDFSFKNSIQNLLNIIQIKQVFSISFLSFFLLKNNLSRRGPPVLFLQ